MPLDGSVDSCDELVSGDDEFDRSGVIDLPKKAALEIGLRLDE